MIETRPIAPAISEKQFINLSQDVLRRGGIFRFKARGWSMFPAIRNGDILNIEPVGKNEIRLGDIIFFRTNNKNVVVHRIIKKSLSNDRQFLIVRGDFSKGCEGVFLENVLGRLKSIERNSKIIHLDYGKGRFIDKFYCNIAPIIKLLKNFLNVKE